MCNIYEPAAIQRIQPTILNYFKGCDHGCVYCYVQICWGVCSKYQHETVVSPTNYKQLEVSQGDQGCQQILLFSE